MSVIAKITTESNIESEQLNLVLTNDSCYIGTILFTLDNKQNEYMVMLSNHYLWHVCRPEYLSIKLDLNTEIEKVEFYQDCRYEY